MLQRPTHDRRALTTAVGFTLDGKIYKCHFDGGMSRLDVVTTLEHLRRYLPDGFILICDRAPIHTSELCLRYFWEHPEICVEPLPKYAPDLNPEEFCHGNVKHQLANLTPADKTVIRQSLERGFVRLRRRPDLLLSFIYAAHLPVRQLWST